MTWKRIQPAWLAQLRVGNAHSFPWVLVGGDTYGSFLFLSFLCIMCMMPMRCSRIIKRSGPHSTSAILPYSSVHPCSNVSLSLSFCAWHDDDENDSEGLWLDQGGRKCVFRPPLSMIDIVGKVMPSLIICERFPFFFSLKEHARSGESGIYERCYAQNQRRERERKEISFFFFLFLPFAQWKWYVSPLAARPFMSLYMSPDAAGGIHHTPSVIADPGRSEGGGKWMDDLITRARQVSTTTTFDVG